jgi:hypothetical protein
MKRLEDRQIDIRQRIVILTRQNLELSMAIETAIPAEQATIHSELTSINEEIDNLRKELREISIDISNRKSEALAKPRQMGGTRKNRKHRKTKRRLTNQ